MSTVDDLFSGKAPPPVTDRARGLRWRIALAMGLQLLGPFVCVTTVPGAVLALWTWASADEELQRVENGALPPERGLEIAALRDAAYRAMVIGFVLILVQIVWWVRGDYLRMLGLVMRMVETLRAGAV